MADDALTFRIKRNDQAPAILLTVRNSDETLFDFSAYTELRFALRRAQADSDSVPKVDAVATNPSQGQLLYQWTGTDTDTGGTYHGEFKGLDGSGRQRTFPRHGYLTIIIDPDLDNA